MNEKPVIIGNEFSSQTEAPWSDVPILIFDETTPEEYFPVDEDMLEVPKTTQSKAPTTTTTTSPQSKWLG